MKVLGISPLDKDATVSLVEDGRVLFAAAEERFSRKKQHAGFPHQALAAAFSFTGTEPDEIDVVAYPFFDWDKEAELIAENFDNEKLFHSSFSSTDLDGRLAKAKTRIPSRTQPIHGLSHPNQRMEKGPLKELAYRLAGANPAISRRVAAHCSRTWARQAIEEHRHWNSELEAGLEAIGLGTKLRRFEHHLSHAANSYYSSGLERALIVTLDGYGSGLAGSISLGEGGRIRRLQDLHYPYSLGTYYETVTASLGFNPLRHGGKIVGLAAYGDPAVLGDVLRSRFQTSPPGTLQIFENLNVYFSRHLASHFPMVDVAAAYQHVLEVVASEVVSHWVKETGSDALVLSGGVVANVKMNQRLHEIDGVEQTFVYPNMGDGGCGTGIAMHLSWPGGVGEPIRDAFLGPSYGDNEISEELDRAGLAYSRPAHMASEIARRVDSGEVVARFSGRMEYGPRALGNRSILYHAREPEVNHWLNQRLGRTEFMPFAPVTLWEARHRCYKNCAGAEHAAQFMTITFDCTDSMQETCPAAVHVDGTARPQLVRREVSPEYYDIVAEYEKLSGIPSLINTSFNMHEQPIVCTPGDAVRAFLEGHLDGLAIGPFFVPNPRPADS
ncbi:MAG: carbamoyltransferase C-terminal domain-containing protein [Thermoanaerobaculia bacterium]